MARITKKDIYAKHGIEFNNGKIYHPFFGWINPLLIDGNTKLGKGIWTFSTLPTNDVFNINIGTREEPNVIEIKGTCNCHCAGCYATNGCYNYSDVKASNARKTILIRMFLNFVERAIMAQIEADKIKFVRIHASGDFDSIEYIEMWKRVINACKDTNFWTYTKVSEAENAFDDIENINVVKSVIENIGLNFGHCDYILDTYKALKEAGKSVYICRCGIDKNQHCNNCKGCSKHEYVLFLEHSTNYVASEDALYETLKNVIESQEKDGIIR